MEIQVYDPLLHAYQVAGLWQWTLGNQYPVSGRVWQPRLVSRTSLELGDGLIQVENGRIIGFGIVEIDRSALTPVSVATIQVLLIDPDHQRRGLGTELLARLEARARDMGCVDINACGGLNRFWSGVPHDLPGAQAFFTKHGYAGNYQSIDLCGPIEGYRMPEEYRQMLQFQEITITGMTQETLGQVYEFLSRESPNWRGSMLNFVHHGDLDDVLVVRQKQEIIGCIQTYSPRTRYRGANVVWEGIHGNDIGGFGSVIIAKSWRGKGLGQAMCQAAAEHIAAHGAATCYIDWTSDALAPFYGKVGVNICGRFDMLTKKLER